MRRKGQRPNGQDPESKSNSATAAVQGSDDPGALVAQLYDMLHEVIDPEVDDTHMNLVWEPAWGPHMMSHEAKRQLGWVS